MELEDNIVELIDEDGKSIVFEYLMALEYNEKEYVILVPMDQLEDDEEDEVVILRVEQDEEGEDIYVHIEDEEEVEDVFEAFCAVIQQDE